MHLQLLSPLGTAYIAARGYAAPEVGPIFAEARELCERIGQALQLFAVVWGNFAWHVVRGEMGLSMELANEGIALAERFDDPGIWMEALFLLGVTLFYRGEYVGALSQYEQALSRYDDRERTRLWASRVGEDAGVTHRCYLALALWQSGVPGDTRAPRVQSDTRSALPMPSTTRGGCIISFACLQKPKRPATKDCVPPASKVLRCSTRPPIFTRPPACCLRVVPTMRCLCS